MKFIFGPEYYTIRVNWWSNFGYRIHRLTLHTPLARAGIWFYRLTVFKWAK